MHNLETIYKPKTLQEALERLKEPGVVVLAGGTHLVASAREDVRAVVDLNDLGLDYIREQEGGLVIGAMTRLGRIAESALLRAAAEGVAAQAAQRSAASLLRNQGTLVGTLVAEPAGILAVALLALEARVLVAPNAQEPISLPDFWASREPREPAIVTEVIIPARSAVRRAALETVARTLRDRPIVSVCVSIRLQGETVEEAAVAIGGAGERALRAAAAERVLSGRALNVAAAEEAARAAAAGLNPPSDYRGSAEYRREMVRVLLARILKRWAEGE